jgi:RimJ/RimL family protein N-acetyltransferase
MKSVSFRIIDILAGRVVTLEPLQADHLDELSQIAFAPELWAVTSEQAETPAKLRTYLDRALAARDAGTAFPFLVRHLESGRAAGSTRFMNYEPAHARVEIGGTWYGLEFQRTAVNTECKLLLMTHAFETMEMNRVELKTDVLNVRSQAAIERIGAQREGVLRRHMITPTGRVRDTVYFSVIREEWPSVKARLERLRDR